MIRQLGKHRGKQVVFGFDRYLLPELADYTKVLSSYGIPLPTVNWENLHYLTSVERVCERMRDRRDHVGILICSTGMGMSIAANKYPGIYAARCLTVDDAVFARTINNANVLCLASSAGLATNEAIIDAFMETPYEGRKIEQLAYIADLEASAAALHGAPTSLPAAVPSLGLAIVKSA